MQRQSKIDVKEAKGVWVVGDWSESSMLGQGVV